MSSISEALASADGTAQSWNEVYQHPEPVSLKSLKHRFLLALKVEKKALSTGAVYWGCPAECGLPRPKLNAYTGAVGLDVDVGVGSLILALNALPGVVTLSSCSSVHEGAHEEEALVAFTCDASTAARVERCVGPAHFREVRRDKVRLKGRSGGAFQSYILRSAALGPDGKPDAQERLRQLMHLATRIRALAEGQDESLAGAVEPPAEGPRKRRRRAAASPGAVEALPLLSETLESQAKALRGVGQASGASHAVLGPLFDGEQLAAMRDEVVACLRGLHPVETEDVCALVHPLDSSSEALKSSPLLARLLAALHGDEFRRYLSDNVGCGPLLAKPERSLLVAVPPGGFWLPRAAIAGCPSGAVLAFSLFLTEDWWSQADGGILEVYAGGAAKPTATVVPRFNALLVYDAGASIAASRVVTDRAPQLAIHGVFVREELPADVPAAPSTSQGAGSEVRGQEGPPHAFDEADREELRSWVAATHLKPKRMNTVRKRFGRTSRAMLRGLLDAEAAAALAELLRERDRADGLAAAPAEDDEDRQAQSHDLGCDASWELVGPALSRRYLRSSGRRRKAGCPASTALHEVAAKLKSPAFLRYLEALTGVRRATPEATSEARRFRPGLDYVRRECASEPRLDAILCLSGGKGWRQLGCADGYVEASADADAGLMAGNRLPPPLLRLRPARNALRLVLRDAQTAHFVEPLSRDATSSRWDVTASLELEPFSEDSEEGEEEQPDAESLAEPDSDEGE